MVGAEELCTDGVGGGNFKFEWTDFINVEVDVEEQGRVLATLVARVASSNARSCWSLSSGSLTVENAFKAFFQSVTKEATFKDSKS
jgi:4-aminobutyrate aminotransferase-like enzyme